MLSPSFYGKVVKIVHIHYKESIILNFNDIKNHLNLSSFNLKEMKSHNWNSCLKNDFLNNPVDIKCINCNAGFAYIRNLLVFSNYCVDITNCNEILIKKLLE